MENDKELLLNWWQCCGKLVYTLDELKSFEELIDKYGTEKVFCAAVASYVTDDGSPTVLLLSMRNHTVKALFASLSCFSNLAKDEKDIFDSLKNEFKEKVLKC